MIVDILRTSILVYFDHYYIVNYYLGKRNLFYFAPNMAAAQLSGSLSLSGPLFQIFATHSSR